MSDREHDELGTRLFQAARAERPSEQARQRTLRAMRGHDPASTPEARSLDWRGAVIVGMTTLAAAAAIVFVVARNDDSSSPATLQAEPLPEARRHSPASAPLPPPPPPTAGSVSQPQRKSPPPAPSARPRPSLADETAALDQVQRELQSGNDQRALELLDRYQRGGSENRMTAEATLLRIEALARAGRTSDAETLARNFIAKNPGNPLVDRARAVITRNPSPTQGANP